MASPTVTAAPSSPRKLTVLFDETCAVCRRCQHWLARQPSYVELELVAAGSAEAHARFGRVPGLGSELVVVSETGQAWVGPPAFLMCLWALRDWRQWSYRLSSPSLARHAERFFVSLSRHRGAFQPGASCADDACTHCP